MNTDIGISFWRMVNEDGADGWAQVYVKIPFDEIELKNKGTLFGVVFGDDKQDWSNKDMELMAWVEEYFNGQNIGDSLSKFLEEWEKKYPDLRGIWSWVGLEGEKRVLKVVASSKVMVLLSRENSVVDFSGNLATGKAIQGVLKSGDRLLMAVGNLSQDVFDDWMFADEDKVTKWNKYLVDTGLAVAGLLLKFDDLAEVNEGTEAGGVNRDLIVSPREKDKEKSVETVASVLTDLAEDRIVGPIGWKEKIINWRLRLLPIRQKVTVEVVENTKRKRMSMVLGLVFLFLLLLSLISGTLKSRAAAEKRKWVSFSEPIEKTLQEARSLVTINPQGAKKLMEEVRGDFEEGKAIFANGKYATEVVELDKQISSGWTEISGERESATEEVLRIDLVRQGFKGSRLFLSGESEFVVLDKEMGVVVSAETQTKDIKVVAGKGEGLGWLDAVWGGNKYLVLNGDGVRDAVTGSDLVVFDDAVLTPVSLGSFGNNLYVLDKGNKEIYKFASVGDSYGDRARWLKQGVSIGFDPLDMAIDSDIWVLSANGQVERFRRGAKEQFSLTGISEGFEGKSLAVEVEGKRLAILDDKAGKVIICDKETGVCSQTLRSDKLIGASDLDFDGNGGLVVLVGGTVLGVK